jgi:hypothetical protein
MTDLPILINVSLDGRKRWDASVVTRNDQQQYAGLISAFNICEGLYFYNKNKLSYNIVGPVGEIDTLTFLNKAGTNLIPGERDFPVTEALDWTLINKLDAVVAPRSLGWWSHYNEAGQADRQEYALLRFESENFIQGFISGCNAFNVDFRDIVIGLPFEHLADGNIQYFDIAGYDIQQPPDMIKYIAKVPATRPARHYYIV